MTTDSVSNYIKQSMTSICSYVLHEYNYDLLGEFIDCYLMCLHKRQDTHTHNKAVYTRLMTALHLKIPL